MKNGELKRIGVSSSHNRKKRKLGKRGRTTEPKEDSIALVVDNLEVGQGKGQRE